MFRRFVFWTICEVLSFLVASQGEIEQGRAFADIIIIASFILVLIDYAVAKICFDVSVCGLEIAVAFIETSIKIGVTFLAAYMVTKIWNVNYFVVFQILELGKCLVEKSNK